MHSFHSEHAHSWDQLQIPSPTRDLESVSSSTPDSLTIKLGLRQKALMRHFGHKMDLPRNKDLNEVLPSYGRLHGPCTLVYFRILRTF